MRKKVYLRKYKFAILKRKNPKAKGTPMLGGFIISKYEKEHIENILQVLCAGVALIHKGKMDYGYIVENPEIQDVTGTETEFTVRSMTC